MSKPRLLVSALFAPTLREAPKDAILPSHRLLLRAGYMRQCAAGIYSLLPLAVRSLDKITAIINEEMGAIGAQRLAMPCLTPAALWKKSGRLDGAGEELIQLKDRKKADFVLGPTHEEVITDLVANMLTSHRQLPLLLYQLDRKFRDEARPRSGLLRCREFWMKDLYTFDASVEGARQTYAAVCGAYSRIFARMGLPVVRAEADTGNIGGEMSHEYHLATAAGDDHVAVCSKCSYAANLEIARSRVTAPPTSAPLEHSDAAIAGLLRDVGLGEMSKCILHATLVEASTPTSTPTLFVWPASRTFSPLKAKCATLSNTPQEDAASRAKALLASGAPLSIVLDQSLGEVPRGVRTVTVTTSDVTEIIEGDGCPCPGCQGTLTLKRGLELGHAFLLRQRYSVPMGAMFAGDNGLQPAEMGCYGIGVSRLLAAAAEAFHDDRGLALPLPISPVRVSIVAQTAVTGLAEETYDRLNALPSLRGEVLLDTSERSLGEKMKMSELLGVPYMIVLGSRAVGASDLEVHVRATGAKVRLTHTQLADTIDARLAEFEPKSTV
eukprot:m.109314 g.109314  ORF g.109314 m.109314 type:complete len:552 (-) comp14304_c0_seq2:775-2430(-)